MTDSTYVAQSMSCSVWNWERNGWKTSGGGDVLNRDLIEGLHGVISGLEEDGMHVRIWRVGREWNGDADAMVRVVLDRVV
jgi:ribonuclease HI